MKILSLVSAFFVLLVQSNASQSLKRDAQLNATADVIISSFSNQLQSVTDDTAIKMYKSKFSGNNSNISLSQVYDYFDAIHDDVISRFTPRVFEIVTEGTSGKSDKYWKYDAVNHSWVPPSDPTSSDHWHRLGPLQNVYIMKSELANAWVHVIEEEPSHLQRRDESLPSSRNSGFFHDFMSVFKLKQIKIATLLLGTVGIIYALYDLTVKKEDDDFSDF